MPRFSVGLSPTNCYSNSEMASCTLAEEEHILYIAVPFVFSLTAEILGDKHKYDDREGHDLAEREEKGCPAFVHAAQLRAGLASASIVARRERTVRIIASYGWRFTRIKWIRTSLAFSTHGPLYWNAWDCTSRGRSRHHIHRRARARAARRTIHEDMQPRPRPLRARARQPTSTHSPARVTRPSCAALHVSANYDAQRARRTM
jgi:hypothetical protein